MNINNIAQISQLVNSMSALALELEKYANRNDAEKTKKVKEELLSFQRELSGLL